MQHFWHIMLFTFKKGKNSTAMQKKRFVQCMEKVLWLIECVKSSLQSSSLDDVPRSGGPVGVDRDQIETLIESDQCYTVWRIVNILKISKSIKLLVKMKSVSFILQKKPYGLCGQTNTLSVVRNHWKRDSSMLAKVKKPSLFHMIQRQQGTKKKKKFRQ